MHMHFVHVEVRRHPQMPTQIGLQLLSAFYLRQLLSGLEHHRPEQGSQPVSFQNSLSQHSILP